MNTTVLVIYVTIIFPSSPSPDQLTQIVTIFFFFFFFTISHDSVVVWDCIQLAAGTRVIQKFHWIDGFVLACI